MSSSSSSFRVTPQLADQLYYATPASLFLIAYLTSADFFGIWFPSFVKIFLAVTLIVSLASLLIELVLPLFATEIQRDHEWVKLPWREYKAMLGTFFVFAQLCSWPYERVLLGKETSFVDTLEESMPYQSKFLFLVKVVGLTFLSDYFTFTKHRLLHLKAFFQIHATHHSFHNPTCFAAFALHPTESLVTFFPVLFFGVPNSLFPLKVHQYYLYYLSMYALLNLYLHCGLYFKPLELTLPFITINTSAFHNFHHSHGGGTSEIRKEEAGKVTNNKAAGQMATHLGEMSFLHDIFWKTDDYRRANYKGLFPTRSIVDWFIAGEE